MKNRRSILLFLAFALAATEQSVCAFSFNLGTGSVSGPDTMLRTDQQARINYSGSGGSQNMEVTVSGGTAVRGTDYLIYALNGVPTGNHVVTPYNPFSVTIYENFPSGNVRGGYFYIQGLSNPSSSGPKTIVLSFYAGGGTGNSAVITLLDNTPTGLNRLLNISSRGLCGQGGDVMTGGFVLRNTYAPQTTKLLIRGIGPRLLDFGVGNALSDVDLLLFNSSGQVIASNDNWGVGANSDASTVSSTAASVFAFSLNSGSQDAAIVISLSPGSYTVQVRSKGGIGQAMVEIYEAP